MYIVRTYIIFRDCSIRIGQHTSIYIHSIYYKFCEICAYLTAEPLVSFDKYTHIYARTSDMQSYICMCIYICINKFTLTLVSITFGRFAYTNCPIAYTNCPIAYVNTSYQVIRILVSDEQQQQHSSTCRRVTPFYWSHLHSEVVSPLRLPPVVLPHSLAVDEIKRIILAIFHCHLRGGLLWLFRYFR